MKNLKYNSSSYPNPNSFILLINMKTHQDFTICISILKLPYFIPKKKCKTNQNTFFFVNFLVSNSNYFSVKR